MTDSPPPTRTCSCTGYQDARDLCRRQLFDLQRYDVVLLRFLGALEGIFGLHSTFGQPLRRTEVPSDGKGSLMFEHMLDPSFHMGR